MIATPAGERYKEDRCEGGARHFPTANRLIKKWKTTAEIRQSPPAHSNIQSSGIVLQCNHYPNGRDTIASVIAHDIGHMLGLQHFQSSTINRMYAYIGTEPPGTQFGEKLITSQHSAVGYPQAASTAAVAF